MTLEEYANRLRASLGRFVSPERRPMATSAAWYAAERTQLEWDALFFAFRDGEDAVSFPAVDGVVSTPCVGGTYHVALSLQETSRALCIGVFADGSWMGYVLDKPHLTASHRIRQGDRIRFLREAGDGSKPWAAEPSPTEWQPEPLDPTEDDA